MNNNDQITYRTRDYATTLTILERYRKLAGITRLADITHLDYTGIPVFTAIRPRAKSLSTSQGKGLCIDAAKCSALMEAIEVYFAENLVPEIMNQSICDLKNNRTNYISPNDLNPSIIYTDNQEKRSWVTARAVFSNRHVLVPFAEFSLNSYLSEVLIYAPSTTGLAGGNSYSEALLHSLLEVIERPATDIEMDVKLVHHPLLQRMSRFFDYKIVYKKNIYDLPSFEVLIKSKNPLDNQVLFKGCGCHVNKNTALNRAITEAIQSRVTIIAGSRDDIQNSKYDTAAFDWPVMKESCDFENITDHAIHDIEQGLHYLYNKIKQLNQDIVVFNYHNDDICVLKSKIIAATWVHHD